MHYRRFALFRFLLLIVALGLASFLAFSSRSLDIAPDHKVIFALDINRTMNTQDVFSGTKPLSRLSAAKMMIANTVRSHPGFSYGLIIFNAGTDYIVPPTFDTGTFFLYLIWVTTNLLPQAAKDLSVLSGVFATDSYASYIIFSDFDTSSTKLALPRGVSLVGVGSEQGDMVRHSNGLRYYDNGKSIISARNDAVAQSLGAPYTAFDRIDRFSPDALLFHGIALPLSQRIVLYLLLWIAVILAIFL